MADQQQQQQQQVTESTGSETRLPRVTIQFCTQCKWMLRAAYFAQELLSTFSTSLGEVALQPATGGVFIVEITTSTTSTTSSPATATTTEASNEVNPAVKKKVLWDRKTDGGFPETKELKRRVRDVIDPGRGLGHVDKDYSKPKSDEIEKEKGGSEKEKLVTGQEGEKVEEGKVCTIEGKEKCEDCQ
ncbi:Rdx family-domain-containing protein [Cercophora samala]|uniref:Rdx family-domain-containing protein n=1 Tax=Cercophora samala TaxID=330535 RepID=A0AA39ZFH2_9PEZI|nr:Rdx family-domain-containing protein [Cercophora samala]